MHEAPIYAQLISERGDVPLQVRSEARRLLRELGWILNTDSSSTDRPPGSPAAPTPVSTSGSRSLPPRSPGRFVRSQT
ncbi:hypothetical protein [Streptomyces sporangiiformans]|uniref:Uncharacterized protein n=1 Tax=Streptomyces sporangiiformans TaxID=2315329 RepID=A0A505DK09_9ACTN|nr:hypothetical protein [Streptomyces sporangiiformans]TPQ19079.1 hypothetical protein FGD71_027890 [Streptomyces sporangiiformans]